MFALAELEDVIPLVRAAVLPTPQYAWPLLKAHIGVEVVVKHENHTPIGAFKVRGGIVYFDRLKRERPQVQAIVTATRGNHGQSLAFGGARAGIAVTIVVPHGNSIEKNAAMRAFGAELIEHGRRLRRGEGGGHTDCERAWTRVRALVSQRLRRRGCDLRRSPNRWVHKRC
jgi:threonine dehydratase